MVGQTVGIGVVIRNFEDLVMASSSQKISATFSPQVAEAIAILYGLQLASDSGLGMIIFPRGLKSPLPHPHPHLGEIFWEKMGKWGGGDGDENHPQIKIGMGMGGPLPIPIFPFPPQIHGNGDGDGGRCPHPHFPISLKIGRAHV